jgi:SAM-dependent methyltransferase
MADANPLTFDSPEVVRSFVKLVDYEKIGGELRAVMPACQSVVEVGCYVGVLLDRLRQQGWAVAGIEPDPRAAAFAAEHFDLTVEPTTVEAAEFPQTSFDAAIMLHVIEHLDDPRATLSRISELLRPGGLLVVETPTYDTAMFRLLGKRERSMSCDGHIFFYTASTLRAALERSGYRVVSARRVGRTVSLGRLLWNVGVMSKNSLLRRQIDRLNESLDLQRRGKVYLNTRDMIRVIAARVD